MLFFCALIGTAQLSVSRSLKECCWISTFSWCMEPKTKRGRLPTLIMWRLHLTRKRYCGTNLSEESAPCKVTFVVLLSFLTHYLNLLCRPSAPKGSQKRMRHLHAWTPGAPTHSRWRGSRWTSLKFTSVPSVASPLRTSQLSMSTFPSTSLMAHPTSVRSAACATPPTARWPDTSLSSIGWRSRRVSAVTTDGARTTTRARERTSWTLQTRTMTGRPTPNAKCVGRCLKRRATWILTWGHMGWRS